VWAVASPAEPISAARIVAMRVPAAAARRQGASKKEEGAEVRAMDLGMAAQARLELGRLVMEVGDAGRSAEAGGGVALQAKDIHVGDFQQVGAGGAMRVVASHAAIHLDGLVLEDEGAAFVHVAGVADGIGGGGGAELVRDGGAVGVMAVAALDQAFVHLVVGGHLELGSAGHVAGVAEGRLGQLKQRRYRLGMVDRMATGATGTVADMHGAGEVLLFVAGAVATEALSIDGRRLGGAEIKNGGRVGWILGVFLARPVAALAAGLDARGERAEGNLGMGRGLVPGKLLGVAGLAGGVGHVAGGGRGGGRRRLSRGRLRRRSPERQGQRDWDRDRKSTRL